MSDEGRKKLKELAQAIRSKQNKSDEERHKKGLLMVEQMSRDLTGDDGMPNLKLWRDAPAKFRVQHGTRNAEISLEWQRDIGAVVMTCQKFGEPKVVSRYVLIEATNVWRCMEREDADVYGDMAAALVEYLYPEGK
jgi:hypothetical protein